MQELEAQLAKAQFARRHLTKMASIGLAALIARIAMPRPAKAQDNDNDFKGDGDNDADDGRCFLKGTKVRTITGERAVEDLAIGDLLPTHFNGIQPIQWIGRFQYRRSDASRPWVRDALPVRIVRSALAADVPHSDLYVSQQHAIFTDGVLVRAGSLVNGATIRCLTPTTRMSLSTITSNFKAMTSSTPKGLLARHSTRSRRTRSILSSICGCMDRRQTKCRITACRC
jgi:Hint domain